MKKKIPAHQIEVCDICHRDGYLQKCIVCQGQYCISHGGTVMGSYGFVDCCTDCARRDDVNKICSKYSKKLTVIYKERQTALRKLPKKEKSRER